jgi:hypothetical protein
VLVAFPSFCERFRSAPLENTSLLLGGEVKVVRLVAPLALLTVDYCSAGSRRVETISSLIGPKHVNPSIRWACRSLSCAAFMRMVRPHLCPPRITISTRGNFDSWHFHGSSSARRSCAGFAKPSATQQKGIVPITKNLDVILQAPYGTGKIATFCMGILNNLDYSVMQCQALVLARTRTRAHQLEQVMSSLGSYVKVKCHAGDGSTCLREDLRILGEGVHVVVATPCRAFEMLTSGGVHVNRIRMFCIDEADEMLSRGFKDQIYEIFQLLPEILQVSFSTSLLSCRMCSLVESSPC